MTYIGFLPLIFLAAGSYSLFPLIAALPWDNASYDSQVFHRVDLPCFLHQDVVGLSVKICTFEAKHTMVGKDFKSTYLIYLGICLLRSRYLKIFLLVQLIDIHWHLLRDFYLWCTAFGAALFHCGVYIILRHIPSGTHPSGCYSTKDVLGLNVNPIGLTDGLPYPYTAR